MADLFWLSDEQWAVVGRFMFTNQPGARRVDDRKVVSGILHMLRTGDRGRDVPAEYGPATMLRVHLAMAAGVSSRLWSMEDIAALVKAANVKPGKRGPHKSKTDAIL